MHSHLKYRPDIDGLRAVAVLAVVFFHAGLGFPGGFVGVDVFFVISGYLITSLIVRDLEKGAFSFVDFWARRIRRIVPALVVMMAATLAVGWFLLLPHDLKQLGQSALAQTLLASNVYFWKTTGYFGGTAEEKPLLHTWSLSVEEQFYVLFPIGVFLVYRFFKNRPRVKLASVLAVGIFVSVALAAAMVYSKPNSVFYLLPTRAWELLVGSLIAVLPRSPLLFEKKWLSESLVGLGILGIFGPIFLYSEYTLFPGLSAMPPCLGTAAIIYANSHATEGSPFAKVGTWLTWKPLVAVGLISYSLYLWHWPIMAYSKYWQTASPSSGEKWLWVAAAFFLATLSWKFVEIPFRKKRENVSVRPVFALGIGALLLMAVVGVSFWKSHGAPFRFSSEVQLLVQDLYKQDKKQSRRLDINDLKNDQVVNLGVSGKRPEFAVWGDSHARAALPAFDGMAKTFGISGVAFYFPATAPVLNEYFRMRFGLNEQAPMVATEVMNYLKRHQISAVFLVAYWHGYNDVNPDRFKNTLQQTIRELNEAGVRVWIVQDVPQHSNYALKALLKQAIFQVNNGVGTSALAEHEQKNLMVYQLAKTQSEAMFLDLAPLFYDEKEGRYRMVANGKLLYSDLHHLTHPAAVEVVQPYLEKKLSREFQK